MEVSGSILDYMNISAEPSFAMDTDYSYRSGLSNDSYDPSDPSMSASYSYSSGGSLLLDCPDGQWIVESLDHAQSIDLLITNSERLMLGVIAPVMTILGLFMNLTFFFVIIRISDMHTTTNFYLANLAVADCLFLIFSTAINMWQTMMMPIDGAQPFETDLGCGLFFWANYLYYFASISFVTLVTFDRYMAVCHAIRYRHKTKIRTTLIAAAAWGVACLFASGVLPNYIRIETHCYRWPEDDHFFDGFNQVVNYCTPIDLHWDFPTFFLMIQVIPFVLAMVISVYCYANIIITFNGSSVRRESLRRQQKEQKKRRNQLVLMLLVMASTFFLCEVPFLVSSIIHALVRNSGKTLTHEDTALLAIVTRICLYLNSSINPLIYSAISPSYRRAFSQAFTFNSLRGGPSHYRVGSQTKMFTLVSTTSEKGTTV